MDAAESHRLTGLTVLVYLIFIVALVCGSTFMVFAYSSPQTSVIHVDHHTCIRSTNHLSQSISCDWGKP